MKIALVVLAGAGLVGCGGGSGGDDDGDDGAGSIDASDLGSDATSSVPQFAELWYSVDDRLVYIALDTGDGSVVSVTESQMSGDLPLGQNMLTMLADGSLLGGRLSQADDQTYFYYLAEPPRDGGDVTVNDLGVMPGGLMLEGLYTDCDGRLYGMDTGADDSSAEGNRLLRFTGDVLAGDFTHVVVSDLATADVADIDDMSPGIVDNEIHDNPGLAIDTGDVHAFNYETGSGTQVGMGGTFGIHALGGPLFDDGNARLYVLSNAAELFEMDSETYSLSSVLTTGPTDVEGILGWSGLAGPLTECDSGFVVD